MGALFKSARFSTAIFLRFLMSGFFVAFCFGRAYSQGRPDPIESFVEKAQTSANDQDLLKAAQNPVADMISLPIQNNINPGIPPYGRVQNAISLQPVIPMNISQNWMLVSRVIQPIVWQPYPDQKTGGVFGLGDMSPTFFLAPRKPGAVIWGAGPALVIPTATSSMLGQGKLALGPSAVALAQPGQWTVGALVSNVWSVAGSGRGDHPVNRMALQYFVSYNLPHEWYLSTAPTLTADWHATAGNVWTVPFGMGAGKLISVSSTSASGSLWQRFTAMRQRQPACQRGRRAFRRRCCFQKGHE